MRRLAEREVFEHPEIHVRDRRAAERVSPESSRTRRQRKRIAAVIDPRNRIHRTPRFYAEDRRYFQVHENLLQRRMLLQLPRRLFVTDRQLPQSVEHQPVALVLPRERPSRGKCEWILWLLVEIRSVVV